MKRPKGEWTIKDKVMYFLEHSERARNDDKYLTLVYWKFADKLDMDNLAEEYLTKGTPATSIVRARCLIQSSGLYPPNPEVARRRGIKEKAFHDSIAYHNEVPSEETIDKLAEDAVDYDDDYHTKFGSWD